MDPIVVESLNKQVEVEAYSSQLYLSMASWCEVQGYNGSAAFLYMHSEEEREHMLKLVKFINDRGGHATVPALKAPPAEFKSLMHVFEEVLEHELYVTGTINELVHITLDKKDFTTHNFLQWYVSEQVEEEGLARTILDKLKLTGGEAGGMYLFDRDIETFIPADEAGA